MCYVGITTVKKLRCKLCPAEFEIFKDLQFHFIEGHSKIYRYLIQPGLADLDYKVRSYEFQANEGMVGHREVHQGFGILSEHDVAKPWNPNVIKLDRPSFKPIKI